ncbi:MAG: diguanylate cyclase [Chloroflexota bacterium]
MNPDPAAAEAPICQLKGVQKSFDRGTGKPLRVLEDVSLDIRPNEVLCLIGPSGCGKSTILRIFAGLLPPTRGEVRYHGERQQGLNPGVSIVFQGFALYPWMTVEENVRTVLRAKNMPEGDVRKRADRAITLVGLEGFEEAYPRELSGGMKQRVGMARALSTDPELLFMDEPFSQVDALTAEGLRAEILDIWKDRGTNPSSILMVSHDIKEVAYMADRIVVLSANPGRVRTIVENPLSRPRDARSPEFLRLVDQLHDIITSAELPDIHITTLGPSLAPDAVEPLPSAQSADTQFNTERQAIFLGTGAAIIGFTLTLALLLRRQVAQPISRLVGIAGRVEAGEDVAFPTHRNDELGRLGTSLEGMRAALLDARARAEVQQRGEAEQAEEQRTVNDFTELLTYLVDEREVVVAATVAMERALKPDGIVVHLLNSSLDRAGVALRRGEVTAEDLNRHTLDRCPGVRRGSTYLIEDVSRPLAVPCPAHGAESGTVACVPLTSGTDRIGAIHVLWQRPTRLSQSAWAVVDRVCSQTALTIANRRLVASLEASANTDPRTRLPNSRSFDVQAERILASRGADSAAVLMLDLDHFKDLNDRFGHPAGDEALRVFAELLRRSLRPGDIPARYGGEEFAVLLPGADQAAAESVAERIRGSLESTPIVLGPGVVARITVSAGVAVAPDDGTDRMSLLAAADRALYAAKNGGRNRVVSAAEIPEAA